MTDRDGMGWSGCPALGLRPGKAREASADWYDAWSLQFAERLAAEEVERLRVRRDIRWMSGLIAAWSLLMGGAAGVAIWIVL